MLILHALIIIVRYTGLFILNLAVKKTDACSPPSPSLRHDPSCPSDEGA